MKKDQLGQYGIDISGELEKLLVDELTKSIDRNIINNLFNNRAKILKNRIHQRRKERNGT